MKSIQTNQQPNGHCAATATAGMHVILSEEDRAFLCRMIEGIRKAQDTDPSESLVDDILRKLASTPGADSAEALRPLVKGLPTAVVTRLPEILKSEGAYAKTTVLSHVGKDLMFRMDTVASHVSAILALTDFGCDVARQKR